MPQDLREDEAQNDQDTVEQEEQKPQGEGSLVDPEKLEQLQAAIKQLTTQNAQLEEAAKKWKEHEESLKTEDQKNRERLAALEEELKRRDLKDAIRSKAKAAGVKDEDLSIVEILGDEAAAEEQIKRLLKVYEREAKVPLKGGIDRAKKPGSGDTKKPKDYSFPPSMLPPDIRKKFLERNKNQ